MADFTYTLGDVKVGVDIIHMEYDPPQDPYSAASDWDFYGNLEVEWEITSATNLDGGVDTEVDMEYLDQLVRKDVMEAINSKDDDY